MSRVLIIPDTHCPCMHRNAISFLEKTRDEWECDRVVHIGDLVDWCSISYHPKAPSLKNAVAEFKKARKQVERLYQAFPKVEWLIGNHDALSERQATDAGLPVEVLAGYGELWGVDGWTVHPRFSDIEIDGVVYRHGDKGRGGGFPAFLNAQAEFQSVIQGHFHSSAGILWGANHNMRYFGMQVGCVVDYRLAAMNYGVKYSKKPILGTGVVIDGVPHWEPMELGNRYGVLR